MTLATILTDVLGDDLPVAIEAFDGTRLGPADPPATIVVRSPDALRRIVRSRGELGFGRAYVAGELDVEGDVFAALELRKRLPHVRLTPRQLAAVARQVGRTGLRRLPPPPEEAKLRGRRHSKARDAAAIAHHYDVSNTFYGLVLGPSMTYSCAVFEQPDRTLEQAQAAKYELICRKLGLQPGMRLLDVGCGWGGMVRHAVHHHGVEAVGVTVSRRQAEWAKQRLTDEGIADRAEVRVQDYREVQDGPFDAISSIGMFEHVGLDQLHEYFADLGDLLRPGGRLLNHAISRPGHHGQPTRFQKHGFIDRYVFPDGELHEVGAVVSAIQRHQLEVRHVEGLREHYALTLRHWVANLEDRWHDAVAAAGDARARIWRLYMAACAVGFEDDHIQVHQVLAVKTPESTGDADVPLRLRWDDEPLS
jgi:cyclopropane-fatty-acyl-phospholipid synthase